MASHDLQSQLAQKKVIVLLTDGQSSHDDATSKQALAAAKADGVSVYTIGIATDGHSSAALQALSGPTHGTSAVATSSASWRRSTRHVSEQPEQHLHVHLREPGAARLADSPQGLGSRLPSATSGSTAPGHVVTSHGGSGGFKVPANAAGRLVLALIAGIIVLLATLALLGAKPSVALHKRISAHTETRKQAAVEGDNPANERLIAMHQLFISTERIIGSMNFWKRMSANLEQADLPLRTAELFYIQIGSARSCAGSSPRSSSGHRGIVRPGRHWSWAAWFPRWYVRFKATKRLASSSSQLPETLITMAASLKAGHAFNQSSQSVVREGADPTAKEFVARRRRDPAGHARRGRRWRRWPSA